MTSKAFCFIVFSADVKSVQLHRVRRSFVSRVDVHHF